MTIRNFAPKWVYIGSAAVSVPCVMALRALIIMYSYAHGGASPLRLNLFCIGAYLVLFIAEIGYLRFIGSAVTRRISSEATDVFVAKILSGGMRIVSEEHRALILVAPSIHWFVRLFESYNHIVIIRHEGYTEVILSRIFNLTFWRFLKVEDFLRGENTKVEAVLH